MAFHDDSGQWFNNASFQLHDWLAFTAIRWLEHHCQWRFMQDDGRYARKKCAFRYLILLGKEIFMSDEQEHVDVVLEEPKQVDPEAPNVEIEEETPEVSAKEEKAEVPPEKGIEELKKNLEREKDALKKLKDVLMEHIRRQKPLNENTAEAQYQLVVNAIETVKERSEALKTAYAESMSVGDYTKAAEIQNAMAVNANQLEKLKETARKPWKQAMKQAEEQPVHQVPPSRGSIADQWADSSEAELHLVQLSGIRKLHAILSVQTKMFARLCGLMEMLLKMDCVARTNEYFEFIEMRLGKQKQDSGVIGQVAESSRPNHVCLRLLPQLKSVQRQPPPGSCFARRFIYASGNTMRIKRGRGGDCALYGDLHFSRRICKE